jgi:sugar O-acyltransferase (sialic acid O-acetyltransferase NeuD family)
MNSVKPLVIFGAGEIAELALFYFEHDGGRQVAAFTLDAAYVSAPTAFGRPVVPFDEMNRSHPPDQYDLFVAVGYSKVNHLREAKCRAASQLGYRLASYVSPRATLFPDLQHGENAFILENNVIQPRVTLGSGVTLWSGNHIGHHVRIDDWCFLASHVVVSGGVTIGEGCFLGVNATLRDHITLGRHCVVGAGAVLLEDAADEAVFAATGTKPASIPSSRLRRI